MTRRYGRAPRGVRLVDRSVPRNTPVNRALVGAMSRAGLLTSMEVEGSIDGDAFFVLTCEKLSARVCAPVTWCSWTTCPRTKVPA